MNTKKTAETANQSQAAPETQQTPETTLLTPQPFHLAEIFQKRLVAATIDMVLVFAAVLILYLPGILVFNTNPINFQGLYGAILSALGAVVILLRDAPYKFNELDAQSPGKRAMAIRVYDLNGEKITRMMSIKRNIPLAVPLVISALSLLLSVYKLSFITTFLNMILLFPASLASLIFLLYEVFNIFKGERHRRWGDKIAETIVAWD